MRVSPNTSYTYTIAARDNTGESRGTWHNSTSATSSTSKYTLIQTPTGISVGTITTTNIAATPSGTLANLTAGSSGVRVTNTIAGNDSGWKTDASGYTSSGLAANTSYNFVARARNGDGTETADSSPVTAWTLSVPPVSGSVTPDNAYPCVVGNAVTWTAVGGFGGGKIQKYKYAWDQSPTHTWTEGESDWTSGTLPTTPTAGGSWYLHVKGYNGASPAVGNGTYDYFVPVPKDPLKWAGGSNNWDFSTTGLWQDAAPNAVKYCNGHDVLLDDSASVSAPAVTLNTAVAPASVTNNSTKNYTISGSGKITGAGTLTKLGSSKLTLSTANDYTGVTTVSAGTLALTGSGSIASSPTNAVASGATFDVSAVTGGFRLASGQTLTGTGTNLGPVTIDSGATLAPGAGAGLGTLTVSNNLTLSGKANLRINKSGSTLTSDQVAGISTLTKGGTLNVMLVSGSGPLDEGDTFPLFSAASSTGLFGVTNLPSLGTGTNWWTTNNYGSISLNVWPNAGGVGYSRAPGMSLKIKIADVLTNVTGHTTGKTIRLGAVGASTNSATITTNSTWILYSPASGSGNDEYFSYTASDGRGGSPSANIHVSTTKWTGATQSITLTNNTVTLSFAGIPNYAYAVQRTTNLSENWTTLLTTSAPAAGLFQWVDTLPTPPPASAYYRLAQP